MTAYMPQAKTVEWETPQDLFDELDKEFHFTLDVCATAENAKCAIYFSIKENGLNQVWTGTCWMNPPYGAAIALWVKKARIISYHGVTTVCLLPVRSDTHWFHDFIWNDKKHQCRDGVELRLLKGRLKFGDGKQSATFPSMIVVFRPNSKSISTTTTL